MADNKGELLGDYSSRVSQELISTPRDAFSSLAQQVQYGAGCRDTSCSSKDYNATEIKQVVTGAAYTIVCLGTGRFNTLCKVSSFM